MTITETQRGIEITRAQDPARAEQLEDWLIVTLIPNAQILASDAQVACLGPFLHPHTSTKVEKNGSAL